MDFSMASPCGEKGRLGRGSDMRFRRTYLFLFTPPTFLSGMLHHLPFHRPASSTTLHLRDIHPKAASLGGSTADYTEQLVGGSVVKRRSVAGVDQDELLDPENLADHDSLFFQMNGVKIHHKMHYYAAKDEAEDGGCGGKTGVPAILLHGFGASLFSWGRIMKPLAHIIGSEVLAFDRPAFGLTSRASYVDKSELGGSDAKPLNPYSMAFSVLATLSFVDMLGAGKAVLIGHSAGCFVAVNSYFESPERVAALILVAPAIFAPIISKKVSNHASARKEKKKEDAASDLGTYKDPFTRMWGGVCKLCWMIAAIILANLNEMRNMITSLFAQAVAAVLRSAFGVMLVRLVMDKFGILAIQNAWYDATRVTAEVLQGYTKPLRAKGWENALLEYIIAMLIGPASKPKPPLLKSLSEITCPVLIITGDTDRIVPPWNARRLAQAIPGSTLEVISKCGHIPHEEKPEEFLQVIEKFLCRAFDAQQEKLAAVAI